MSPAALVAVLLVAGLLSWALRAGPILALPAAGLPPRVRGLLDHAAPAALAAMVGAGIAAGAALPDLAPRWPVLVGALVTVLVARRRRGLLAPVAAGLLTVAVLGLF